MQSIEYGPLYSLLYVPFIAVLGVEQSIFVMRYMLTLGVTLLLFIFLLGSLRSLRVATGLTFIWIFSAANIFPGTMVFHLALALFLITLIFSRINRFAAWLFLLLAGFVRPEYFGLALVYGCYIGLQHVSSRFPLRPQQAPPSRYNWALLLLISMQLGLVAFLFSHVASINFSAGRSWLAFQQHYAFAQVIAGRYHLDPWADFPHIIARDLPNAQSLSDVVANYPTVLLGHIFANLAALPQALVQFLLPVAPLRPPMLYGVLVPSAMLCGLVWLMKFPQAWHQAQQVLRFPTGDLPILALIAPLTIIPNILINLRFAQYFMILMPFLFYALGIWGLAAIRSLRHSEHPMLASVMVRSEAWIAPVVLTLVAVILLTQPRPFLASYLPAQTLIPKLNVLQSILPQGAYTVYGGAIPAYIAYLCPTCRVVYPLNQGMHVDLAADLARHQPAVVAIDSSLLTSPSFDPAMLTLLEAPSWQPFILADEVIYVQQDFVVAGSVCKNDVALMLPRNWRAWYDDKQPHSDHDRRILALPAHFWVYTAQARHAHMQLTPDQRSYRSGATMLPEEIIVHVNGTPTTRMHSAYGQVSSVELSLRAGYNQIWLDTIEIHDAQDYIPAIAGIIPAHTNVPFLRLLTFEPLP
ncbi:hypothetical protein [Candidatus Viridilinea mediisalina]|uniref:hypothetical protein n=1 Tax=Candidatus Viridilinea mediisalina TaxID=2024553 RepID=UPI000F5A910D|nr:hypothetical protein [Candidatus Viridilinea mediisalina]